MTARCVWRLVNGMGGRLISDTSYQSLQITFNDGSARLKLVRPDTLNRFDERLHEEFALAIEEIGAQPDVAALIIILDNLPGDATSGE